MPQPSRPLVSVIIPNFNHGRYLGAAIESVLAQPYRPIEVIVVDNCSTDESWDLIMSYRDRGVLGLRYDNGGVIAAGRNYGLSAAAGEFVAFLDADDTWHPDKLEYQMPFFDDPTVVLVAAGWVFTGDVSYGRPMPRSRPAEIVDVAYQALIRANPIATSSVVVRSAAVKTAGGFDESRDFRFIEDWELWLRLSGYGRLRLLAKPLIQYRLEVDKVRDHRDVAWRKFHVINKHASAGQLDDAAIQSARGNVHLDIGRACLEVGDWSGIGHYLRGLRWADWSRRPTAVVGLALFLVPQLFRRTIIRAMYAARFVMGRYQSAAERS